MANLIKTNTIVGGEGVPDALSFDAFYFLDPHDGLFDAGPLADFFQTQNAESSSSAQVGTDLFGQNGNDGDIVPPLQLGTGLDHVSGRHRKCVAGSSVRHPVQRGA